MSTRWPSWLLAPFYAAAVATSSKSFGGNPIIGSPALNRAGLHVGRMRLAHAIAGWRRRRLLHLVSKEDAMNFHRDGFVLKRNYLPEPVFEALKTEVMSLTAPARDMIQGDAVTRRIGLDARTLARLPAVRALVENREWLGLVRYVGSSALAPFTYIQTIFSHVRETAADPQTHLHMDTFHSTVKAWFFLTDVGEDDGPFTYVPGSHRLTAERIDWEKRMSIAARESQDRYTREGSFRIFETELAELGLPKPRTFAVPANTLVVADTMGFHARGLSVRQSVRIEIWAYGRRNPFLLWTGFDPLAMPLVKGRTVPLYWSVMDLGERFGLTKNPWRPAGSLRPDAPVDLSLFN